MAKQSDGFRLIDEPVFSSDARTLNNIISVVRIFCTFSGIEVLPGRILYAYLSVDIDVSLSASTSYTLLTLVLNG